MDDLFGNVPTYLDDDDRNVNIRWKTDFGWEEHYFSIAGSSVIGIVYDSLLKGPKLITYSSGAGKIGVRDLNKVEEKYPHLNYVSKTLPDFARAPAINDSGTKLYYLQTGFIPVIYDLLNDEVEYKFEFSVDTGYASYFFLGDNYVVLHYEDDVRVVNVGHVNERKKYKEILFDGGYAPKRLGLYSFIFFDTIDDVLKIVKMGLGTNSFDVQTLTYNGEEVHDSDSLVIYPLGDKYIVKNYSDSGNKTWFWIYDSRKNEVKEYVDEIGIYLDFDENKKRYRIPPLKRERVKAVKKMADFLGEVLRISDDLAKIVCEYAVY